ncbi:MAG: hypothetical protein JRJ84_22420, partial [Deltaproteobacteria bacterium]|nr:hypothetical protein [Deltaproteobacteria bacterium]
SFAGRSGTVLFDLVDQATDSGMGIRVAWAIGGDRYTGLGFLDALVLFENDPTTRVIVLNCEAGGIQEQLAAGLIATGVISKPVIAMVTGKTVPAGVQYGHPGSTKITEADDPAVKERHLRNVGCLVVQNPTQMVRAIEAIERTGWNLDERRRDALWDRIREADGRIGRRWLDQERAAFDLLHGLVGHWRLHHAHETSVQHLHELVANLTALGVDGFSSLLGDCIDVAAFVAGFDKSREYTAELLRGASEVGIQRFRRFIVDVLTTEAFNAALRTTPWAAADILNEAHQVGLVETVEVLSRTVGLRLFRQTYANKPWNSAHAFRSINNMRRWRFVRAYHRLCTHLLGDAEVVKAAWKRNPWATVKLVRGYDRVPEEGLEKALEDPEIRVLFVELATTNPQGLLNVGKRAFRQSNDAGQPFEEVYRPMIAEGTPARPTIEGEIARMGEADFAALVDTVFTAEGFERSRQRHPSSTARALQLIMSDGDDQASGAQKLVRIFQANVDIFDTHAFRVAVQRNLWMAVDLLRAVSRLDPVEVRRIVDYVLTKADFDFSVEEHQWGTSQAFHKIADMGARVFFEVHQLIEDATQDRESFRTAFKKNPRDTVQIAQVVTRIGRPAFFALMSNPGTCKAFLTRMCKSPRTAANFLHQVEELGAAEFDRLVDEDLGREVIDRMLEAKGPDLVRTVQRIAIVGVDDFREALRAWKAEKAGRRLTWENAFDVVGEIKERVLHKRFSQPHRRVPVTLPGQARLEVSEAEIQGLFESYPDWADVLLKLKEGKPLPVPEQVDVYELVSGRKRFQMLMVPVLANFVPLRVLRQRASRGERLIPEISRLKGVAQGEGHRFDAYTHALEVLEQLHSTVLPLGFVDEGMRWRVNQVLDERIDHVTRRDLLVLATALHDLGKGDG